MEGVDVIAPVHGGRPRVDTTDVGFTPLGCDALRPNIPSPGIGTVDSTPQSRGYRRLIAITGSSTLTSGSGSSSGRSMRSRPSPRRTPGITSASASTGRRPTSTTFTVSSTQPGATCRSSATAGACPPAAIPRFSRAAASVCRASTGRACGTWSTEPPISRPTAADGAALARADGLVASKRRAQPRPTVLAAATNSAKAPRDPRSST